MVFQWFSELFNKRLAELKFFESVNEANFGTSQIVFQPLRSSISFDVRETLKCTVLEEECLKNILWSRIITEQDSNDEKVIKIAKFVNNHLTYKSDQELHYKLEYWCNPYVTYKLHAGDCDDYSLLIMKFLELANIPEWRRRIVVGKVRTGEGHAYVTYFSEGYNDWFVIEGSIILMMR